MQKIYDEISRLKDKAELVEVAQGLISEADFLKKGIRASEQTRDKVLNYLKECLKSLVENTLNDVEPVIPFNVSQEEILAIKTFLEILQKKQNTISPKLHNVIPDVSYVPLSHDSPPNPAPVPNRQPVTVPEQGPFPRKGILMEDISATDADTHLGMTVKIIGELDGKYKIQLPSQRVLFVDKEIIEE